MTKPKKGTMAFADWKDMASWSAGASLVAIALFVLFYFSNNFFSYYASQAGIGWNIIGALPLAFSGAVGWIGRAKSWEGKKGFWIWILSLAAGIFLTSGFDFPLPR